jgi:hypothetical protein
MTRRTIGIVLLQTAVVAVLLVVVYVTLLAPEKSDPLFDVSVPPEPSQLAPPPRGEAEGARGEQQGARGQQEGARDEQVGAGGADVQQSQPDRRRSGEQPSGPLGPAGTGLDAAQPPIAAAPPASNETPADDQYDDAVSQLLDRL